MKQMKKYLVIFAVLFTVILSSCSNDYIPAYMSCTIRVNPNTVISEFKENKPGELTVIPSGYQLRVHLFLYDESGNLKQSSIEYSPDYSHIKSFNVYVEKGNYRLLTTTDIVKKDGSLEYWSFTDEENLSSLKINSTNYVSLQVGILGYASKEISIDYGGELFEIDAKPAGALIFANVENMKSIADVEGYQLYTNRDFESVQFTSDGKILPSIKSSNTMDWRTVILNVNDVHDPYTGLYTYYFSLPVSDVKFEWRGITKENKYRTLGNSYTCSMNMGEEFAFNLNANTKQTSWEKVNLSTINLIDPNSLRKMYAIPHNNE